MGGIRISLLAFLLAVPQENSRDLARAQRLARSIELYAKYSGNWPASLENLVRRPDTVRFWPEGGFWLGELPPGATWKNGEVKCGQAVIAAEPPNRSTIVPPTDRLKTYYTARIRLALVEALAEEYITVHGQPPEKASALGELPLDPWGKPFVFQIKKASGRVTVEGANEKRIRPESLTEAERKSLEDAARIQLSDPEVKRIHELLNKLSDDDYETREEATQELRRIGPAIVTMLRERTEKEKNGETRSRLRSLLESIPVSRPGWSSELAPLAVPIGTSKQLILRCKDLIRSLSEATIVYEFDHNAYPPSGNAEWVKALKSVSPKKFFYFEFTQDMLNDKGEVIDPWGNPLVYRNNNVDWPGNAGDPKAHNKQRFDIYSFGPNGTDEEGGGDDINNWD